MKIRFYFSAASVLIFITAYLLRFKMLMLFGWLEFIFLPGEERMKDTVKVACQAPYAYHRGFSQEGKFVKNSKKGFDAAVLAQVERLELDVNIDGDMIYLDQGEKIDTYPLPDFFGQFSQKFKTIIVDIKKVTEYTENSIQLLLDFSKHFSEVIYIGRKCDLLAKLSLHNPNVSCEAMGYFGHKLMGWPIWSVLAEDLSSTHRRLLKSSKIRPLIWTFENRQIEKKYCDLKPLYVLIDFPDNI